MRALSLKPNQARKLIVSIQCLSSSEGVSERSCIWWIEKCKEGGSAERRCLSRLSNKAAAVGLPLPRERNSIIHMAFQRAWREEVVTCVRVTLATSLLNSSPSLSLSLCQLLLRCSADSMTSSRTTTPATTRRRPSRRRSAARRSTTVEGC